jgi:hypothetical protein
LSLTRRGLWGIAYGCCRVEPPSADSDPAAAFRWLRFTGLRVEVPVSPRPSWRHETHHLQVAVAARRGPNSPRTRMMRSRHATFQVTAGILSPPTYHAKDGRLNRQLMTRAQRSRRTIHRGRLGRRNRRRPATLTAASQCGPVRARRSQRLAPRTNGQTLHVVDGICCPETGSSRHGQRRTGARKSRRFALTTPLSKCS